jgi:hypothetical protein
LEGRLLLTGPALFDADIARRNCAAWLLGIRSPEDSRDDWALFSAPAGLIDRYSMENAI